METVYEGTLEEILARRDELQDRRLRVTILDMLDKAAIRERVERMERGLALAREISKDFPPVPERHITLDFLYPDETSLVSASPPARRGHSDPDRL